jgi:hypothetical protein
VIQFQSKKLSQTDHSCCEAAVQEQELSHMIVGVKLCTYPSQRALLNDGHLHAAKGKSSGEENAKRSATHHHIEHSLALLGEAGVCPLALTPGHNLRRWP